MAIKSTIRERRRHNLPSPPVRTAPEKDDHGKSQADAQLASVKEMVKALLAAEENDGDTDNAREAIEQDALSVETRGGWQPASADLAERARAFEYKILLCTGGPAVQITGRLNDYNEPESAALEYQDWFTPWTEYPTSAEDEEALLRYAQVFYYGEG